MHSSPAFCTHPYTKITMPLVCSPPYVSITTFTCQVRLNERNVVELINKLQQLGLLGDDLLHTMNGREYVTTEHLRKEVLQTVEQAGGRIALVRPLSYRSMSRHPSAPCPINLDMHACMHARMHQWPSILTCMHVLPLPPVFPGQPEYTYHLALHVCIQNSILEAGQWLRTEGAEVVAGYICRWTYQQRLAWICCTASARQQQLWGKAAGACSSSRASSSRWPTLIAWLPKSMTRCR